MKKIKLIIIGVALAIPMSGHAESLKSKFMKRWGSTIDTYIPPSEPLVKPDKVKSVKDTAIRFANSAGIWTIKLYNQPELRIEECAMTPTAIECLVNNKVREFDLTDVEYFSQTE